MLPAVSSNLGERRPWMVRDVRAAIEATPGKVQSLIEQRRILVIRQGGNADDEALLALGAALGGVMSNPSAGLWT
jgi:hypothetical protein